MRRTLAALALPVLLSCAAAVAQDEPEERVDRVLDDIFGPGDAAPADRPSADDALAAETIDRNLDEALANYERLLAEAPEAARRAIRERIAANEILLARYRRGLDDGRARLREVRVRYSGEATRRAGATDELLVRYQYEVHSARSDIAFYERELAATEARLERLRQWAREQGIDLSLPLGPPLAARPTPAPRASSEPEPEAEPARPRVERTAPRARVETATECPTCGRAFDDDSPPPARSSRRKQESFHRRGGGDGYSYSYYGPGTCPSPGTCPEGGPGLCPPETARPGTCGPGWPPAAGQPDDGGACPLGSACGRQGWR